MSDICADLDAVVEMVQEAQDELAAKDEKNELIAYLSIKDKAAREVAWQALLRRFSKDPQAEGNVKGTMELTHALVNYLIALEVALGKRKPKPIKPIEERMNDPKDSMWDLE